VEAGTVKLAGVDQETIYAMAYELLTDSDVYKSMANAVNPYGDGQTAQRIVSLIKDRFMNN
jgi:UDP-N-acetylglucosamine 2-epimerase (non-hydrolysing)